MSSTTTDTNGHADAGQPSADMGHDPAHTPGQSDGPERVTVTRLAKEQVLLQPKTKRLLRELATRLGRTNDAVVRRALYLLAKQEQERAKTDDDWADEVAS